MAVAVAEAWGVFVTPSLWEQFCWWVSCRSPWAYCSCLWGLNTPVSTVEVLWEPRQIPSSLFLLHSLQKPARDNTLDFPLVIRISDAVHVWLFCLDHFQYIHISSEYIHTSYSLFILQYLPKIHFRKFVTSEKIWGSFLCLSPLNFLGVFCSLVSQLHQAYHYHGTDLPVCFGCVVKAKFR